MNSNKRIKYFNILSSAFEFAVSTVPVIIVYILCILMLMINNVISDKNINPFSIAVFIEMIKTACADIEFKYMTSYLILQIIFSNIKCILCYFIDKIDMIMLYKFYTLISCIASMCYCILFIIVTLDNVWLLIIFTSVTCILEVFTIMVNIDYIYHLQMIKER